MIQFDKYSTLEAAWSSIKFKINRDGAKIKEE